MSAKRSWGVFGLCLMLSVAWHLFGMAAIGTVDQPAPGYAAVPAPMLMLKSSVETLFVGVDVLGKPVTRLVTSYADPDFFGFPRVWAFGKFQSGPESAAHRPFLPPAIEDAQGAPMSLDMPPHEFILGGDVPGAPLLDLIPAMQVPSNVATGDGRENLRLALRGPLAMRKCLIAVLPSFAQGVMGKNRSLVLGSGKRERNEYGLLIRLWVGPYGEVRSVLLESSSGNQQLDDVALRALRQWRFEESQEGAWGKAVLESGQAS